MSSREYLRIHTFDQRVVTRVSVGTQTDWRDEEDGSRDCKYTKQETSQAPRKNFELTSEQSVSKHMKSELEISPDNEVLDSLSEETPQTPAACQVETEESLTNLDKIPASSGLDSSEEPPQTAPNICCQHCRQLKKAPVASDQIAKSVDPEELFCCKEALKAAVMLKGAAVIADETVTDRDPAMQKDQRVNLTPWGGTYCSDTGDLKKQWSWLDNKHHVHAPPCRPLCLTLSTNLSIRIQSQENICITFTSGKQSVQLDVGAKLRPNRGKGLTLPGPDMLQRHLQQKSAEINVLLQNIQSLITYQKTVSPRKVKSRQSLISQMERRRLPMKQQQPAKKTP
ncbi:Glutamate-rich protein 6B [Collichthys lucidus]|uniref:Glutamate-rich protein 6B n=1 Tax=Collichthys lucidus TaxID=240159 RepID=A0A4U5TZJ5_COLLU|nr:Glutamate-rich protein 6B [Collichthys lucidus]